MDKEQLQAELSRIHGCRLGEDDPILMMGTIYQLCLAEGVAEIRKAVDAAQDQISAGQAQQIATAKETAGKIITDAAVYAADRLRAAGDEAAGIVIAAAREQMAKAETARRAVTAAAYLACGAVALGLAAGAGFLLAAR